MDGKFVHIFPPTSAFRQLQHHLTDAIFILLVWKQDLMWNTLLSSDIGVSNWLLLDGGFLLLPDHDACVVYNICRCFDILDEHLRLSS